MLVVSHRGVNYRFWTLSFVQNRMLIILAVNDSVAVAHEEIKKAPLYCGCSLEQLDRKSSLMVKERFSHY